MIENVRQWIINITTVIVFISFIEILMPNGAMKKYLNLVLGFVVILIILNPIINTVENKNYIEDELFEISNSINQNEYIFASSNIENIQREQLLSLYKSKIKSDMKGRLESKYEVEIIDVNIDVEDSKEDTGKIKKIHLKLEKRNRDIEGSKINNSQIPIISINISEENDNIAKENRDAGIAIKDQIRKEISQVYDIEDSSIIIN